MSKTKEMIVCSLFAAVICIAAPFAIVIGPVPVTMTIFAIALTAFSVGSVKSAAATLLYILIGLVGLPVFSNFQGGVGVIMNPTGGFIFSYVFVALILGRCTKTKNILHICLLCTAALLVCYFFGTVWFVSVTQSTVAYALSVCIVPFIPFDIIKLVLAYIAGSAIRRALIKAKLV